MRPNEKLFDTPEKRAEAEDLLSQFLAREQSHYREMREAHGNAAPKALLNRLLRWWGLDITNL